MTIHVSREQFDAAKAQCPDAILLFRVGDFYEAFYDDAKYASKALGLTLTTRDRDSRVEMCGFPYYQLESYIAKLVASGKRVAVCERVVETGKLAETIKLV
jgi:DNA mismatch repair protein MutS